MLNGENNIVVGRRAVPEGATITAVNTNRFSLGFGTTKLLEDEWQDEKQFALLEAIDGKG